MAPLRASGRRRAASRWRATVTCVLVALTAFTATAGPSIASAASPAAASPTSARTATAPSDTAATLRTDVAAMLQDYLARYGDRFTSNERRQLLSYRADADRQLAAVVVATRRLEQATATGASLAVRRARGAAAQAAWRRARSMADSSFASARQILEPRLSLIERLGAARDYSTMMGRFDALGAQIDAAAARAVR